MPSIATPRADVTVRDWREADLPVLHAINEASVPGVGSLTTDALAHLIRDRSAATLVAESAGDPVGFVLCMVEGLDYASLNYKWLSQRLERFAYVDRIAVAPDNRGQKIGEALYQATIDRFTGKRAILLAEVNLAPPNPGSLRFHQRHGFREIGERWEDGRRKGVVYLERML